MLKVTTKRMQPINNSSARRPSRCMNLMIQGRYILTRSYSSSIGDGPHAFVRHCTCNCKVERSMMPFAKAIPMVDKTICTGMLIQMVSTNGTIGPDNCNVKSISSWIPLLHHAWVIIIDRRKLLMYIHILTPAG